LWNVAAGNCRLRIRGARQLSARISAVAVAPDGKTVAGADDDAVRLWDATNGRERLAIPMPESDWTIAVAFSPDGTGLATGTRNGVVQLWDATSGKELKVLREAPGQHSPVRSVAFSPDGEILAAAGRRELWRLPAPARAVPPRQALPAEFPEPLDTAWLPKDLARFMSFRDQEGRSIAAEGLAEHGARAVPLLLSLLDDESEDVGVNAAKSLGRIGPEARSALPALVAAITDGKGWVRYQALQAIRKIDPDSDQIVPGFVALLHHELRPIRLEAARELRQIDPEQTAAIVEVLIELLSGNDGLFIDVVVGELGRIGPAAASAVPKLSELLRRRNSPSDSHLRINVADALGNIGPGAEAAVPVLVECLDDDNHLVRIAAVKALGKIGPAALAAGPALKARRDDSSPEVRAAAADALEEIDPGVRRRPYLIGGGVIAACLTVLGIVVWFRRRGARRLQSR
jgi:HEAT repeat protein